MSMRAEKGREYVEAVLDTCLKNASMLTDSPTETRWLMLSGITSLNSFSGRCPAGLSLPGWSLQRYPWGSLIPKTWTFCAARAFPTKCHGRILYTVVLWLDCCVRKSSTLFGVLVKHFSMLTCRVSLTHTHRNTHHFENKVVSLVVQLVKNPPALQETWVRSLDVKIPLEKGKATHSSILARRIPGGIGHGVAESQTRLSDFHFLWKQNIIIASEVTVVEITWQRSGQILQNWTPSWRMW